LSWWLTGKIYKFFIRRNTHERIKKRNGILNLLSSFLELLKA
jgi:hypothetical protein